MSGEGEAEAEVAEFATVRALAPYDDTSITFRTAVYKHPELVRVRLSVDGLGDVDLRVAELVPGASFIVRGPDERPWQVLLTCEEAGWYSVARWPVAAPDAGGGASL